MAGSWWGGGLFKRGTIVQSVFLLGLVLFRSIVLNINILSGHFDFYQDITIEMTADNVENYQTLS